MNIPNWKIFLIAAVSLFGVFYSAPNFLSPQTREWMQETLPSFMPMKSVNLGLDLRGGAHLLYEVDVDAALSERADIIEADLRKTLREEKIGYTRLGNTDGGVRVTMRDPSDGENIRKILRRIDSALEVTTSEDEKTIEATIGEAARQEVFDQTLSQSIEIVRRRIDELGTTEPIIQRQGERRILIQAPGADAPQRKQIIGTTAKLTFHLLPEQGAASSARTQTLPMAETPERTLTIFRNAVMTGDMLQTAQPSFRDGQPVITFRFNSIGAKRFCEITRENVEKPFAIVLDSEILTAPNIRQPICGGSGEISGNFTVKSANDLALLLRAGALPAPMQVVQESTVGPTLGADSIAAGKLASIVGFGLIVTFMALVYSLFGLFANIALVINVALILAILSTLQATLTLPGIAGIVLTIGMAVDANVLIFERIKEELAAGRSVLSAIESGYERAMSTIMDSNLTTLIAAFILFAFGTGPIKGFAVTLSIGIITSLFSAVLLTRLIVMLWYRAKRPQTLPL